MFSKKQTSKKPAKKRQSLQLSQGVYKTFNALLPIALWLLIRAGLIELSIIVAMFSKWRVFAVRPRHLLANLRANAVDIIVKLSTLSFMIQSDDRVVEQLLWTAWYVLWLVVIKPGSTTVWVSGQALAAHVLGLSALLYYSNSASQLVILLGAWIIGLSAARHFLSSYEEPESKLISSIWGFFVLQMTWILSKWMLVYVFVPQLVFIIVGVSYAVASIYGASKKENFKISFVRQQIIVTIVLLVVIAAVGDWGGGV